MNNKSIIAGTTVAGFTGGLLFTSLSCPLGTNLIAGLAAGALGLMAKKSSLQQNESLSKRDFIHIGSAGLIGGFIGGVNALLINEVFRIVATACLYRVDTRSLFSKFFIG